jgi:radical SAM superfamily enzyme YgiQ (UPF0313 family)
MMNFGFESGSNNMLKILRKGVTVEQAYTAIEMVKKAGMKVRGQLMTGLPGETDEDVEATATFVRTAKEVDAWGIHILRPFPGTPMWEHPEKYGLKINTDTDFDDWHTCGKVGSKLTEDSIVQHRLDYLRSVAAEKSVERQAAKVL